MAQEPKPKHPHNRKEHHPNWAAAASAPARPKAT